MRRALAALALVAAVALVAATAGNAAGNRATVKTRHGKLGMFLVGGNGKTLYLFEKDKTSKSTCTGQCAQFWPPLLTSGKAKASGKARGSLLGTTRRSNGKLQVTYKGHPVYYFSQDSKPGDTMGQDFSAFGAKWYVLAPNGKKIDKDDD
jgi:predicted lipoprotein with Yx(FWY)xxD motif